MNRLLNDGDLFSADTQLKSEKASLINDRDWVTVSELQEYKYNADRILAENREVLE